MHVGQKVHYIPFEDCDESLYENGMIKALQTTTEVRVVYHCNNEWDNLENYTSALTPVSKLREGWVEKINT